MASPRPLALLVLALVAGAGRAQEPELEDFSNDPSREDYEKALATLKRKRWIAAQRAFERFIEKWPDSPFLGEAIDRSGDNRYLGVDVLWKSGPSERRIDVAVMGDGFTDDASGQNKQEKWAKLCLDVLWSEEAFAEYRDYFNFYFVRLASLEEGVDPSLSPEELRKIEEKNRHRRGRRKKTTDYSTALDAKAAGPQGQVMCDRALVYKWLDVANREVPGCGDDKFVIAFAQFGQLGMGGGGIANVGRPDKSITTHEFGHAFSGLLDEYTGNPTPPQGEWARTIQAANASTTDDPEKVPWAHMLRKRVKGVGIFEGGATFDKGVWRPARSCAMNAAGAVGFCPVCREATILVIYAHVSPIDAVEPADHRVVNATEGDETVLSVTPMKPQGHDLDVEWYVASAADPEPVAEPAPDAAGWGFDPARFNQMSDLYSGARGRGARDDYATPPRGERSRLGTVAKGSKRKGPTHVFPLGKLPPGDYQITVEVRDRTKWVVKDEKNLLAERASWTVHVAPRG